MEKVSINLNLLRQSIQELPVDLIASQFERGDRVCLKDNINRQADVIKIGEPITVEEDDGSVYKTIDNQITLITPAKNRKIKKGDLFSCLYGCGGAEYVAEEVDESFINSIGDRHHPAKNCTFRYRPKSAHTWEVGQWEYDGNFEHNLSLAPADGWKVGDTAVCIYGYAKNVVFDVAKINDMSLEDMKGESYEKVCCRHLITMQIEGETEIEPGRFVRTLKGWDGIVIRFYANDNTWLVEEINGGRHGYFKSSELILLFRPPKVSK